MSDLVLPAGVVLDGAEAVVSPRAIKAEHARARGLADRCDELLGMSRVRRRDQGVRFSRKQIEAIRDQAREKADAN